MKKLLSMFLVLLMLLSLSSMVYAADMGIQIIGGPEEETESVSLDDIKIGKSVIIEGYAEIEPTTYTVQNTIGYYKQGKNIITDGWGNYYVDWYNSGTEAEFIVLHVDIINLSIRDKNFLENVDIRIVFDEKYEYSGWSYQLNYDNGTYDNSGKFGQYNNNQNIEFVIDSTDNYAIGPMYEGHYFFGCTLPNAVVNSKLPLSMIITIDGNELTYNIRK